MRIGGRTSNGYHVFLGADLDDFRVGEVVGRVAEEDVPAAVEAVVGTWESLRHGPESLGQTARRVGLDAFAAPGCRGHDPGAAEPPRGVVPDDAVGPPPTS